MIILLYVDDILLFGPDQGKIDQVIKDLQEKLELTIEDEGMDVFNFLGVEIAKHKNGRIELLQSGLIKKILRTLGVTKGHWVLIQLEK